MRAVQVREFGPPEVLRLVELDDPEPGAGQVMIDVAATHVLWVDTAIRRGAAEQWFPLRPPFVPGTGVTGTITATGAGVDPGSVGQRVAVHTGTSGGYAERVVVPAAQTVPLPDAVPFADGAALTHDATTAQALLDTVRIADGDTMLVVGASGGLGLAAIQLARHRGARVVALARDATKIARIRAATGAIVIDTEAADWPAQAAAALPDDGADVVFDNVGGPLGTAAVGLAADGARVSTHGTPGGAFTQVDPDDAARRRLRLSGLADAQFDTARRMQLMTAGLAAAARGEVRTVVGQTFPLADAAAAHAAIENRTVFGATVLLP